jgi:hypothetical protein
VSSPNLHFDFRSLLLVTMPFYTADKSTFEVAGREFPRVTWYKTPGMRGLYVRLMFVILTSATNGYDGSMMNGLQALDVWNHRNYYQIISFYSLF